MSVAFLKEQSLGRILAGHPWVYASDVLKTEKLPSDGGEIVVRTAKGAYVGTGFFNSKSRIPIRILSRAKEKLDEDFFRKRITEAQEMRKEAGFSSVCRLVWSEGDFLPGLIVDRYEDALVIQTLTLAMDERREMIADILIQVTGARAVVERNEVSSRQFEGLPLRKAWLRGDAGPRRVISIGGVRSEVDLLDGQKTGLYLDQIGNQQAVGVLARGRRVLDCFTYHGGFALRAALGGAREVEGLDMSEEAIAVAKRNAELNGAAIRWKAANVFDELNARQRGGESYDMIILDPPSFTKSRAKLEEALRGYKEIHLRALKLLAPKGLLATFCCSHHVDAGTFRSMALDAAFDAHKILRLCRTFTQPADHPVIPAIPETEYLKGFLFQVV